MPILQHRLQKERIVILILMAMSILMCGAQEVLQIGICGSVNGAFFAPTKKSKALSDVIIIVQPSLTFNAGLYALYTGKKNIGAEGRLLFQQNKITYKADYITDGLKVGLTFMSFTGTLKANYRIDKKKVSIIPAFGLNIAYNSYFGISSRFKNSNGQAPSEPLELAQSELASYILAGPEISVTIAKANNLKKIGISGSISYTPYITSLPLNMAKFKVYNAPKYLYIQGFYSYLSLSVNFYFNKPLGTGLTKRKNAPAG